MDNKGKPKSHTVSDKINVVVQFDAHIGTCVEQASHLGLAVPTLNPIVKKHDRTERNSFHCRPFSKQC
jgi:hypothetical protein